MAQPQIPGFDDIAVVNKNLDHILSVQESLTVPRFTYEDAFNLGIALRERILPHPKPTVISIRQANNQHILFQCTTGSGTLPDNDVWVARKTRTVLRFGVPTFYLHAKFEEDRSPYAGTSAAAEKAFAEKFGLGPEEAGQYAIHGGGVPVKVKGVEGVVAVVVVSGLKQYEDHEVVVEVMKKWIQTL
ncbi:hypothetical protein HWV62_25428 [Athelia sp. TMB]|nr:hypothetical protein HWV62_25428 [Athelia sp. TMB]